MKRMLYHLAVVAFVVGVPTGGHAQDVNKVLADARAALGGEKKLAALKTLTATGQAVRVADNASSAPTDTEMAFEFPDKFMKKDVVTTMGNVPVTRTSGFNGDATINVVDQPPSTGGMVFRFSTGPDSATATPEQQEEARRRMLLAAKQDFARIVLGIIATSPSAYPLGFSYGGQAESPDGKADIVEVKGEGDLVARLFIDSNSHLPLMLSWMAKEPLQRVVRIGGPGGPGGAAPGHGTVVTQVTRNQKPTPEEMDKLMKQAQEQAKEAEAKLRVVEYRLYYGDYRDVDGIKVPFKLQRSIDGKPAEEVTFEKVKVNGKIDPKKFDVK